MISDLIHELGQNLRRNRTRTLLTGLSVAWGIFMLVVLLGFAKGTINSYTNSIMSENNNILQIWPGRTVFAYRGFKPGRRIDFENSDLKKIADDNPHGVARVMAVASQYSGAEISTPKGVSRRGITGVFPGHTDPIKIVEGRFINDVDMDSTRKTIVISKSVAKALFSDSTGLVGRTVNSMGLAWRIVGVYDHRWRTVCYVPYTTLKRITGSRDVDQLIVEGSNLKTIDDAEELQDRTVETLSKAHTFDPRENRQGGIWVYNAFRSSIQNQQGMSMMKTAMWVMGILTLLTGIVGISNIMFVAVKERTHEIGIRRAIGAKPRRILLDIVAESIAIALIFGYVGIVLGMAATEYAKTFSFISDNLHNPGIDLSTTLELTIVLTAAGALAGLFPAIKATKVKPVEALRDE